MKKWQCTVCGYVHNGDEPPDKCPVCGADKSLFKLIEDEKAPDSSGDPPAEPKPQTQSSATTTTADVTRWRCTVCGYIHNGDTPPDKCPVCGADKSLFVPADDATIETGSTEDDHQQTIASSSYDSGQDAKSPLSPRDQRIQDLMKLLTKIHGHPIAVHLPNGLLPVAVFFTIVAIVLGSESFAIAARYNMGIVAMVMPIVIATGVIDWRNRFNQAMTIVFKVKIACAAVVTFISIILAIWWIINPDIYNGGLGHNGLFLLFNLIDLGAAGLAGWYGGKLVFRD